MYVLNCCSRPMRLCICMHLHVIGRLASMTLPRQQAGVEVVRPPVIRPSKVVSVGKVITVPQTQALNYDHTVKFSTQWLREAMPSYRALGLMQLAMCVHYRCRFWVAATGHNCCTKAYEVEAAEEADLCRRVMSMFLSKSSSSRRKSRSAVATAGGAFPACFLCCC